MPVDLASPASRQRLLLERGLVRAAVTSAGTDVAGWPEDVQTIIVEAMVTGPGDAPAAPHSLPAGPQDPHALAYVLLTSGSTGEARMSWWPMTACSTT